MLIKKVIVTCSECGTVNDSDAKFCKECGCGNSEKEPTRLADLRALPRTWRCTRCKNEVGVPGLCVYCRENSRAYLV